MDNVTYYSTVKLLHIIGMSAWFGTALVVSIVWSKKDGIDLNLILDLITKVEMPASFFIPLTGVLMTIDQTYWLNIGWIQLKIVIGLLAVVFSHFSRAMLIHHDMKQDKNKQKFSFYRNICLLMLFIVIIIVGYK
jgi:uncharacterized membrane protein